jgi:hypothetical protein
MACADGASPGPYFCVEAKMHRVLPYVLLTLIALITLAPPGPAVAGDYYYNRYYDGAPVRYEGGYYGDRYRSYRTYDDGYRYRPRYRYGSSDCCYRRVVKYRKVYRDYERPYYSNRYVTRYSSGYRSYDPYYSRPYYGTRYTTRYYDGGYRTYDRPYRSYYSRPAYGTTYYSAGYSGNYWRYANQPRTFHVPACTTIRYKVYDDLGGWVWGKRRTC